MIRHGQSVDNALDDVLDTRYRRDREVDPPLTVLGKQWAQLLAEHLATGAVQEWVTDAVSGNAEPHFRQGFGITSLLCGPMYRSMQTAELVDLALGLSLQVSIDISPLGLPSRTR